MKNSSMFFSLIVVIISGFFIYKIIELVLDKILSMNNDIVIAVVAVSGTIMISVFSLIIANLYEKKKIIREEQSEKKRDIYTKFIYFIFDTLFAGELKEKKKTNEEIIAFLVGFMQELIPWGGDQVVNSFVAFRQTTITATDPKSPLLLLSLEELLFAIRKDLGHSNKGLNKGDILRLFINDVDTIL